MKPQTLQGDNGVLSIRSKAGWFRIDNQNLLECLRILVFVLIAILHVWSLMLEYQKIVITRIWISSSNRLFWFQEHIHQNLGFSQISILNLFNRIWCLSNGDYWSSKFPWSSLYSRAFTNSHWFEESKRERQNAIGIKSKRSFN